MIKVVVVMTKFLCHRPFTTGKTQQHILEVEGSTARLILRKAVATICAHTGYTDTSESVLRLLTDVTHEFLTKITGVLRSNTDNLLLTDRCPFHVSVLPTQCFGKVVLCLLIQILTP